MKKNVRRKDLRGVEFSYHILRKIGGSVTVKGDSRGIKDGKQFNNLSKNSFEIFNDSCNF